MSSNELPESLAPRRRASLLSKPRPQTSYGDVNGTQSLPTRRYSRLSLMPGSYDVLEWREYVQKQKEFDQLIITTPDLFATMASEPQPQPTPHQRRASTLSQSFKHGISELRSLGRRMSVSMKAKATKQKEEMVDIGKSNDVLVTTDLHTEEPNDTTTPRPKSRGWMFRSSSMRRRPSLPLLNFTSEPLPAPPQQKRSPVQLSNQGLPLLSDLVYGGAGARASAAAQNERFHASRTPPLPPYEPIERKDIDSESGIGIVLDAQPLNEFHVGEAHVICHDPAAILATELAEAIFSYLDVKSLLAASRVSRRWRNLSELQAVWKQVFYREFDKSYNSPFPTSQPVAGLGKNLPGQDYRKLFKIRTMIEKRWNCADAAAIYLNGHKDSVYCVQFDEHKIVTGSRDNTIRIWDAHTYQCIRKLGPPNNARERGEINRELVKPQGIQPAYTCEVSSPDPTSEPLPMYHQASVLCLQYDEEILVTGSSDFSCLVWSIKDDYKPLFRLHGHTAGVLDVCIDQHHIVTCSKDTTIKVWQRATGSLLKTLTGHRGPVNAVQVRGNLLASASGDGMSKLWRLEDGQCIKEFQSKDRGLACVEFSDDGRTIFAGGNDRVIYEYDTVTGNRIRELAGHRDLVRSLHLDTANSRIISGSYDHSIRVWDARKGETIDDGGLKITFEGWASSWMLAAKSNYRKIVCTSQDGRVVVIDFGYGIEGVDLVEA